MLRLPRLCPRLCLLGYAGLTRVLQSTSSYMFDSSQLPILLLRASKPSSQRRKEFTASSLTTKSLGFVAAKLTSETLNCLLLGPQGNMLSLLVRLESGAGVTVAAAFAPGVLAQASCGNPSEELPVAPSHCLEPLGM